MDDLSFQARAVWDSFLLSAMGPGHVDDDRYALAAALRAAADQVVPLTLEEELFSRNHSLSLQKDGGDSSEAQRHRC